MSVPLLADACPRCAPGDHPAVLPSSVIVEETGSVRAVYQHSACGAGWTCWWDPGASGWPLNRAESAA